MATSMEGVTVTPLFGGAGTSTQTAPAVKRKFNPTKTRNKRQKLGDVLAEARDKAIDNAAAKKAFFDQRTPTESVFKAIDLLVTTLFGKQTHLVGVKMALSAMLQMLKNARGTYKDENGVDQPATAKVRLVDGKETDMKLLDIYNGCRTELLKDPSFIHSSFDMGATDQKPKGVLAAQMLQMCSMFCAVFVGVSEWLTGRGASFCSRNGWNLELCALSGLNSLTDGAKRQMLDCTGLATRADYLKRLHERGADGKKTRDISTMSKLVGSMRVAGNADSNRMLNFILDTEDFSLLRQYLAVSALSVQESRTSKVLYNPTLFIEGKAPPAYFENEQVRREHAANASYTYLAPNADYAKCLGVLTYLAVDGSLYITKDQMRATELMKDIDFDRNYTKKIAKAVDPKYNTMKMSVSKMSEKGWTTRTVSLKGVKLLKKPARDNSGRQGKELGVSQDGRVTAEGLRELEHAPAGVSTRAGISSKEEFLSLYTAVLGQARPSAFSTCIFNV